MGRMREREEEEEGRRERGGSRGPGSEKSIHVTIPLFIPSLSE